MNLKHLCLPLMAGTMLLGLASAGYPMAETDTVEVKLDKDGCFATTSDHYVFDGHFLQDKRFTKKALKGGFMVDVTWQEQPSGKFVQPELYKLKAGDVTEPLGGPVRNQGDEMYTFRVDKPENVRFIVKYRYDNEPTQVGVTVCVRPVKPADKMVTQTETQVDRILAALGTGETTN